MRAPLVETRPRLPLVLAAADVQLVVVNSGGTPLADFELGPRQLSYAWLNPVGGDLAVDTVERVERA